MTRLGKILKNVLSPRHSFLSRGVIHCNENFFAVHCVHSVRRTQVLDDESDYFASDSNQWLSPAEREKVRKKEEELRDLRHASRKDRKITLDFAGRQVIDEGNNLNDYYKK